MNIGVVGLGLIGGSVAKAVRHGTPDTVLGADRDRNVLNKARLLEAVDLELTDERIPLCDKLIVALYPRDTIAWVTAHADAIRPDCVVMDCCGVKEVVCAALFPLAQAHGFRFIGAHPMAGVERTGFDNASGAMFRGASLILTPPPGTDPALLCGLEKFWGGLGFDHFEITTPAEHDRRIAFTSQLAHVVSSAYIQSPTALAQHGFAAGSYRDMTRVARLNEKMWAELFCENADNLTAELDGLLAQLSAFRAAVAARDEQTLTQLLREGRERKALSDREDTRE